MCQVVLLDRIKLSLPPYQRGVLPFNYKSKTFNYVACINNHMDALDILYTPLDTPEVPDVDVTRLLEWVATHTTSQKIPGRLDASKDPAVANSYPWNIIYPRNNTAWLCNFDKEFPQLAEYFYKAFDMDESDLFSVVMLPVKTEFSGLGFWHSDPDKFGLRIYLENQEPDEFLKIRPTVFPYTARPLFGLDPTFKDTPLQDSTYSATLRKRKQTFYINNTRAVHAVQAFRPGTIRIAVIIASINPNLKQKFNDLIVRSAEKYKDLAILWEPQK
jgi:hypothetical protein